MADIIPYINSTQVLPTQPTQRLPGQYQIVHFTVTDPGILDDLLRKIGCWFSQRDEVLLVQHGVTASGLGFAVMEWDGCAADTLFLSILEHDEFVDDYSVYTRDEED